MPIHDQITDTVFRAAVDLLDQNDAKGLAAHVAAHPSLVGQRVRLDGMPYFETPTLLEFAAENPIRTGVIPPGRLDVVERLLDLGFDQLPDAMNGLLGLAATGSAARECGLQLPLVELLCSRGADPGLALLPALAHGEDDAAEHLIWLGAPKGLAACAALGTPEDVKDRLDGADADSLQQALALAVCRCRLLVVQLLLAAGADAAACNPPGFHAHSTPLHQAAVQGCQDVAELLIEHGASPAALDTVFHGTPAGWARHAGHSSLADWLDSQA